MSTKTSSTGLNPFATATAMLEALRQRQISAVELLEQHLQRIARYNPALNAIVTPNYEAARETAAQADAARARGEDAALLGLPLVIKDCIYVKGLPTTGGLVERANAIAPEDSQVPARVRAAGAVIMGKTNVPPYAADWQSNNPLFGRTNNPWNLDCTPGGSTGGGAAALAAGLTPLEFGGDFGGSIRIPAAFCGVYGHKPSETAVPRTGHFPGPLNTPNSATGMAVQGPLARSAGDLELALDVIAGPDVGEDVAWKLQLPPARHERLADYRVAVLPSLDWVPVDPEITGALEDLAGRLGKAGVKKIGEAMPEGFGDLQQYFRTYISIFSALSSVGRPEEECRAEAKELRKLGDLHSVACADGLEARASDYVIWFGQRQHYRSLYRAFFQDWDVLLAPANIVNAFPHLENPLGHIFDIGGRPAPYNLQFVYPGLCNLSGHPGTAFPAGRAGSGLPIGLQAIAPYLEDRTSLRFAALLEAEFGGFQAPPGYES